jgi:hypothetical protein
MPRKAHPDLAVEAGRGSPARLASTRAEVMSSPEFADRAADRAGARDLDEAVEQMPGLTRAQRDRERAMPRDRTSPPPDRRMDRGLPGPDDMRRTLSSRQRKARSITKRAAQDSLRDTEYHALHRLVTDPAARARLNDALSDAAGDVQQLPDGARAQVQRVDRAIAAYERSSDRGHRVYVNLEMPDAVGGGHPLGVARAYFPVGTTISLDRFTGGAHTMHEVEPPGGGESVPVLEIATRRGVYLGRSDSLDDTTHVLPRGFRARVVGFHTAVFERPDGTLGRRPVMQLQDITES